MEIKIKVCSCQKEKFSLWENFSQSLKSLLKEEVKLEFFEKFPQDLEKDIDLFYASFSLALHLIEKDYKPVAKFIDQGDYYLVLSPRSLSDLKEKDKIKVILTNRAIFFYLLFYFTVSRLNIDFSKIQIILKDSNYEVEAEILKDEGDLYILPEKTAKPYLEKFLFKEKFPFKVSHYFMIPSKTFLFEKIKKALFLIDKKLIKSLGFENIEEVSSWEEEFIKFGSFINKFFPQLIEKTIMLDTFLNAFFLGVAIYHEKFLYVNPYFCKILGYTLEEFKELAIWDVIYYEEDKKRIREVAERRLKGEYFFFLYQPIALKTKDGKKIETLIFASTIWYQNKYCGFVVGIDISELKKLQRFLNLLRQVNQILIGCNYEEEIYEKILPIIKESLELKGVWISDQKGKPLYLYPEDFKIPENLIFPEETFRVIPLIKDGNVVAYLNLLSSEEKFFTEEVVDLLKELQEDLIFAIKKVNLLERDLALGLFAEKSEEMIIITDEKGTLEYINSAGEDLLGIKKEELAKENIFKVLLIPKEIINLKEDTTRFVVYLTPDKVRRLLELKISFIKSPFKSKAVIVGKDLTKELEFERERELLQYHDSLTGLPNRRGFIKKCSDLLNILNKPSALIITDFYRFSYINHFYGFETGNFCLKELAKRFQNVLKDRGFLGRTGGDEFCLFIIDVEEGVGEWIKILKDALSKPIFHEDKKIFLDWNMGIVIFPQDGTTIDELWKKVNLVLVEAKKGGPNTIKIFNSEIEKVVEETFQIELLIKKAFKENLFIFYYQPYFETETLKLAGIEALVRIKEKDNLILPFKFINTLENSPYLFDFNLLCFEKNIKKIKKWEIPISLNLSSQSFKLLDFSEFLNPFKEILFSYPYFLILEITEHTLIENIEIVRRIIETIKSFKIKIALDDFGTGFSSLNYLKDLPIDIIKIDISFIKEMVRDTRTYKIVEAIIDLSHFLGIKVVAEGVETKEQFDLLKKLKCDYVQGFFLCKPLPEEEIEKLFS